jgi:hypothetical protein
MNFHERACRIRSYAFILPRISILSCGDTAPLHPIQQDAPMLDSQVGQAFLPVLFSQLKPVNGYHADARPLGRHSHMADFQSQAQDAASVSTRNAAIFYRKDLIVARDELR